MTSWSVPFNYDRDPLHFPGDKCPADPDKVTDNKNRNVVIIVVVVIVVIFVVVILLICVVFREDVKKRITSQRKPSVKPVDGVEIFSNKGAAEEAVENKFVQVKPKSKRKKKSNRSKRGDDKVDTNVDLESTGPVNIGLDKDGTEDISKEWQPRGATEVDPQVVAPVDEPTEPLSVRSEGMLSRGSSVTLPDVDTL